MARIMWHSCAPWSPSGYGMQTAVWIQELAKMGHEVFVSSYWGLSGSATDWNGITILPGFGSGYCSTSLSQHYKAYKPDLVITLGDIWVLDAGLLREMRVAHWLPCDCRPMSLADRANAEASGAQLMAMSRFGYERFAQAGFRPVYSPHGIDTGLFSPLEDRDGLRREWGVEDKFVIGINAANNDAIRKGISEQMLAFARFRQDHDDAVLALHSGVHQEGGQDLEALAENLGITDCLRVVDQYRYHAGIMQPSDLRSWYGAIDVLSACSFGEGFGLPIIEAQSCGTPVITTDASSMTELNPHGQQVSGDPFWNGVHKGWWIRPSVSQITDAYERAYAERDNPERDKLREFAKGYDKSVVAAEYMKPAVDELLRRFGRD